MKIDELKSTITQEELEWGLKSKEIEECAIELDWYVREEKLNHADCHDCSHIKWVICKASHPDARPDLNSVVSVLYNRQTVEGVNWHRKKFFEKK